MNTYGSVLAKVEGRDDLSGEARFIPLGGSRMRYWAQC